MREQMIIDSSKNRKRTSRRDVFRGQETSIDFSRIFILLQKAKTLIETAKQDDGQIDASEAAGIFNELILDLEKIGGEKIQENIVALRTEYRALIEAIDSAPFVSHLLRDTYPNFFVLFQESEAVGAEENIVDPDPDIKRQPESAPISESAILQRFPVINPPSPEPGVIFDAQDGHGEKGSSEVGQETVWARMRQWARPVTDSDIYRVHMKGEKTRAELDDAAPTLSRPAMVTGAVLSGALSYFGAAFPLDALRYMSQKRYVAGEHAEILAAFRAALADRAKRDAEVSQEEGVQERSNALRERVLASRYLTDVQKHELLDKLSQQERVFAGTTSPSAEHLNREVGRILEHAIRTRITGEKVAKEAVNTALVVAASPLFLVAGANFLRAPAYGAVSLYERWNRLTREMPESKAGDRLRATISGGFHEYFDQLTGKKGRLAQAAALGTVARFVGMGETFTASVAASGYMDDLLRAWEGREAVFPPYTPDLSDGLVGTDSHHEFVPGDDPESDAVPDEIIPVPDVSPEVDVILSPEEIPAEALVGIDAAHNGITQALLSGIEARPDLLRVADRAALSDDYAAALLMRRFAAKDGLLDYWLSDKAVGELAIVPMYDADGVGHIAFLNPKTGAAYSIEELKELGWLVKAP